MNDARIKPILGLTVGDMNGIGPEVVLKACASPAVRDVCRPVVFGPFAAVEWFRRHIGPSVALRRVDDPAEAGDDALAVLDTPGAFDAAAIGTPTVESGAAAIAAIEAAFAAWKRGAIAGMVTAPISKHAIAMAGSPFKGHTDMLAALCGSPGVLMVLTSNTMRVGLVTIHVPVSHIAPLITAERVLDTIRMGRAALTTDFGIARPRLALLALNPHAGDEGAIGSEEADVLAPALEAARREGVAIDGPFAADGYFSAHNRDRHDMIIAMYHDQGLIPFKMQAAGHGVNVSCGLPIVRTSPDHGTAFGIAGSGLASADSMIEALELARGIVDNRARIAHTVAGAAR